MPKSKILALKIEVLKLYEANPNIRIVQVIVGKTVFIGSTIKLRKGFVLLFLEAQFVGKISLGGISEIALFEDMLTITLIG